jgi:uncharacterized membrane protein
MSLGQRVSDRVSAFGGSWPFIGLFGLFLVVWVVINAVILARRGTTFDPYPFILLNLFLSMLAAVQAPVILMSQNRQAAKDRLDAAHDYEVNLKAELEILTLHEKIDSLREQQWGELMALQRQQIILLEQLLAGLDAPEGADGPADTGDGAGCPGIIRRTQNASGPRRGSSPARCRGASACSSARGACAL